MIQALDETLSFLDDFTRKPNQGNKTLEYQ